MIERIAIIQKVMQRISAAKRSMDARYIVNKKGVKNVHITHKSNNKIW